MQLVCPQCGTKNRVPEDRLLAEPICGRCGTALMSTQPIALSDANFDRYIAHTELPVLVDFWADWCGPCKTMAPAYAQVAREQAFVRFAKVDTQIAVRTAAALNIRSIPTLILFQGGLEQGRISGALPAQDLSRWLQSQLKP